MKIFRYQPKKNDWLLFVVFCFLCVFLVNRWIEIQIGDLPDNRKASYQEKMDFLAGKIRKKRRYKARGDIIRYEMLEPNRKFAASRFMRGKEEIARFRSQGEKIFNVTGEIPDGKIQFVNVTENRKGTEHYRHGRRHGRYNEYYDNGNIYREAQYFKGKEMLNKVYYYDGTLRMEEDRRDALIAVDDREAGKGRVYYRNGVVMYEWELTNALDGGTKASYNIEGDLREIKYYNTMGRVVEVKTF